MLLSIYQRHVAASCRTILFATDDIQSFGATQTGRFWYGIQNLVIGAGNVSKALWGTGKTEDRKRRYAERQPLRDSLGVTDDSPFRHVDIRNDIEHLDERIETWWAESPNHIFADENIGPDGFIGGDAFGDKDMLRTFNPQTNDLTFWGNTLNVREVVAATRELLPKAEEAARHWPAGSFEDEPRAEGGGQAP